jgi:hypothetical protein
VREERDERGVVERSVGGVHEKKQGLGIGGV